MNNKEYILFRVDCLEFIGLPAKARAPVNFIEKGCLQWITQCMITVKGAKKVKKKFNKPTNLKVLG